MAEQQKTEEQKAETRQPVVRQEGGERRPARAAVSPFEEIERLFEDFLSRRWMSPFRSQWPRLGEAGSLFQMPLPRVDVMDREDEVVVRAEIPGIKKEDLDISLGDDTLTLRGSTREEKEERGEYYRRERSQGEFFRTVALPAVVDASQAKATFADGILEVTAPKVASARRRRIMVE